MPRKSLSTPRSKVRAALRALWLRSRERSASIKREHGCCEVCGVKQSVAKGREVKLEVHHLDGIEWDLILEYIYRHILVDPSRLMVLCKKCHEKVHNTGEV